MNSQHETYIYWLDKGIKLTPSESRIAYELSRRRITSTSYLISCLWGGQSSGGPDYAKIVIRLHIYRMRNKGMNIILHHNRGYELKQESKDG
jgi:DNA-binding response OmpR family regulator